MKTALKLLLVFVEYTESNTSQLIKAINTVDSRRGLHPWVNIMSLLSEKDGADSELLVYTMTLVNKVSLWEILFVLPNFNSLNTYNLLQVTKWCLFVGKAFWKTTCEISYTIEISNLNILERLRYTGCLSQTSELGSHLFLATLWEEKYCNMLCQWKRFMEK